jgi:autotransporter-associated beta strand protein
MRGPAAFSRWQRICNSFAFGGHTMRSGFQTQKRRHHTFEALEERSLLSVCHWTGGADNRWSNPQNWDSAPQAGDELVFQGSGIATQNDLAEGTTFKSIKFASDGFTLMGNAVSVDDSVTVDSGVANAAVLLDVALGRAVTVDVAAASSSLTFSRVISGGALGKAGAGALVLGGASTYTGGTTISDGAIVLGADSALGADDSAVNVAGASALLNLNGHSPTVGKVVLTEGSIVEGDGDATISSSSYILMKGTIDAALAGDGWLTKISNDSVTISGATSYSGLTTVSAGELRAVGSKAWDVVFNQAGADIQGGKLVFDYCNDSSPASAVLSILDASYADGSTLLSVDNGAKIFSSTAKDANVILDSVDDAIGEVAVTVTSRGDISSSGTAESASVSLATQNSSSVGVVTESVAATSSTGGGTQPAPLPTPPLPPPDPQPAPLPAPQPALTLSGPDTIAEGAVYTLLIGAVTGITVQSYAISWGDGTTPETYTAAQMGAANGQVTHVFASGISSSTITVGLTDTHGHTYPAAGSKTVVVAAPAPPPPMNVPPVISGFGCANDFADMWTLSGTVTDANDPVAGDVIRFGGVLTGFHLTTTVKADGTFELTVELHGLQEGTATAQTTDPHGALSNLAGYWIIVA